MSAEHTRGPWRASARSARSRNQGVYDADGYLLASVDVPQLASFEVFVRRKADARVMAAAPAMAQALRSILLQVVQGGVLERDACIAEARAALDAAGMLK
jgi:hypothetical protein